MKTLGETLDDYHGVGAGFDFLRIFLSASILLMHSITIAQSTAEPFTNPLLMVIHDALVPMFFALSGFLITGSAMRLRIGAFLINRSIRIVPALAVDIIVAATIIGPVFTQTSLSDYFSNHLFREYFLNSVGYIHYFLPGVFARGDKLLAVNASLWTVPFEIGCYALMSMLIIFGVLKKPALLLAGAAILTVSALLIIATGIEPATMGGHFHKYGRAYNLMENFFGRRGLPLYVSFVFGCLIYIFRHRIPQSWPIAIACLATPLLASLYLPTWRSEDLCAVFSPALAYLTVFVGLIEIPPLPVYKNGDYSYGIYLYGYPFQRALTEVFPNLTSPAVHFAISLPMVTLVAMASWHFVEKPILSLRKRFSFTARKGEAGAQLPIAEQGSVASG